MLDYRESRGAQPPYDTKLATAGADTMGSTKHTLTWDFTTGRVTGTKAYNEAKGTTSDLGTTDYTYDPAGRLTSRTLAYPARTSPPAPDRQCYTYDWAGRLAQAWTTAAGDCTAGFSPAAIGGPAPYAQAFEYTPGGDRAKATRYSAGGAVAATEEYTYGDGGAHRLASIKRTTGSGAVSTDTFAYDPAGRMTDRAGQAIAYTP